MELRLKLLAASVALTCVQIANADDDIRWNGYLNVVGGILKDQPLSDDSGQDQHPGYGSYEDNFTFDPETSAALQASKRLDDKTQVTAQIYAEGSGDGAYSAKMKWLYLTYDPTDTSSFRIGKLASPFYFFSDFIRVGMAYNWVSPPSEIYLGDLATTGVDYIYRDFLGDEIEYSLEAMVGNNKSSVEGAVIDSNNQATLVVSGTMSGWLTLRLAYTSATSTLTIDALDADTLVDEQLGGVLPEDTRDEVKVLLAEKLDLNELKVSYITTGLKMDLDPWQVIAEYSRSSTDSYLTGGTDAWYVCGGYRFDWGVIQLTYADSDPELDDDAKDDLDLQLGAVPLPEYVAAQLGTNISGATLSTRHSISAGVRVNTSRNTALKFEITKLEEEATIPDEERGIGDNLLFRTALNVTF